MPFPASELLGLDEEERDKLRVDGVVVDSRLVERNQRRGAEIDGVTEADRRQPRRQTDPDRQEREDDLNVAGEALERWPEHVVT